MLLSDQAKEIISRSCPIMGTEITSLSSSLGRALAEDIVAREDVPTFDNSGMDGYALRTSDDAAHMDGISLKIVGEVAAGDVYPGVVGDGEAVKVMTGAPIPTGADAVIEQEQVKEENGKLRVSGPVERGCNIRSRGEDIRSGDRLLERGKRLRPFELGVLASLGISEVSVYARPEVAILTMGNELVPIDQAPGPGQIRNSNAVTLQALVHECGAKAILFDPCKDDEDHLREALEAGLLSDVLISSGGVSVGEYDLVLNVLKSIGVKILFWRVNIKPGKPVAFGLFEGRGRAVPVFALPGNSVSTAVTFIEYVRPALLRMMGATGWEPLRLMAELKGEIRKNDGKRQFLRGILRNESGRLIVQSTGSQGSAVMTSFLKANCLIIVPEEVREVTEGNMVEIKLL